MWNDLREPLREGFCVAVLRSCEERAVAEGWQKGGLDRRISGKERKPGKNGKGGRVTDRRGRWEVLWLRGVWGDTGKWHEILLSSLKGFLNFSLIPGPLWTKQLEQKRVSHDPVMNLVCQDDSYGFGGWCQACLLAAGLLDGLGSHKKKGERSHPRILPHQPPHCLNKGKLLGGGSMETTSPRMQHSALSSEDGFVLHNGKNNAPGLSLPPKGDQCGFQGMDSQLG